MPSDAIGILLEESAMPDAEKQHTIRNQLSPQQRNYEPQHSIDAGFLNYRRLHQFVPEGMRSDIAKRTAALPTDMIAHFKELNN